MQTDTRPRNHLRAATVAASMLLGACATDTTAPVAEPAPRTFRAALSGGVTKQLSGGAFFGRARDGQPGEGWGLMLATSDGAYVLALAMPTGALPTVGTYDILPPTDPDAAIGLTGFLLLPEAADDALQIRGGTLRITRASPTALVAEVELRARGLLVGSTVPTDVFFVGPLHAVFSPTSPVAGAYAQQHEDTGDWPILFDGSIPWPNASTVLRHVVASGGPLTVGAGGTYAHQRDARFR